jgi:hypothetical protein
MSIRVPAFRRPKRGDDRTEHIACGGQREVQQNISERASTPEELINHFVR